MKSRVYVTLVLLAFLALLQFESPGAILTGDYFTHDPSRLVKCNGKYFVYFTGPNCPMRYSTDMVHWQTGPAVLSVIPAWARTAVPGNTGDWIWAPDVIYLNNKYYLFYAFSTFGRKISVIGLVTSPTLDPTSPDYHWTDQGEVVSSIDSSNFNAIDPCPVLDDTGDLWLSFGSWFGQGIVLVKLDKVTAKPISAYYSLAAKQRTGPEASYIYRHGAYYYLFENEGFCCQGMNSTYRIMMGRSKAITGPYLDKLGKNLADGAGSLFLGTEGDRIGPGCVGILSEGGVDRFTYHYYDGTANGRPTLGLETLVWDSDGWPRSGADLSGGHYAILEKGSGRALSALVGSRISGELAQQPYRGNATQQWNVSPTGDGYYSISNVATGLYLDLAQCGLKDGTQIDQSRWQVGGCQQWQIEATSDGVYRIVARGGGGAITLSGASDKPVVELAWSGTAEQEWQFRNE